jgi:hypothetical protein
MIQRIDTLPSITITKEAQIAKNIREISMDREYLVKERTRIKNQLHTLLYRIFNTEYAKQFKDPFSLKALKHWMKAKPKNTDPFLLRSMKRKVNRLLDIREEISELETELKDLIANIRTHASHSVRMRHGDCRRTHRRDWRHRTVRVSRISCQVRGLRSARALLGKDRAVEKNERRKPTAQQGISSHGAIANFTVGQCQCTELFQEKNQ